MGTTLALSIILGAILGVEILILINLKHIGRMLSDDYEAKIFEAAVRQKRRW